MDAVRICSAAGKAQAKNGPGGDGTLNGSREFARLAGTVTQL
jgi:hypothetical protein